MRPSRWIPFALALCLVLPAALAAVQACTMAACSMQAADAHGCCPQPEARLEVDCCFHGPDGPAELPAKAAERAPAHGLLLVATPVVAPAPPQVTAMAPPEAAGSPPRDLLARHCILRI
jgi:hypothetical protein